MSRPLLVIAMREEWNPLRRHLGRLPAVRIRAHEIACGERTCDVLVTGPGRKNVEDALLALKVVPSAILHVGVAGALTDVFRVGDVRVLESVRLGREVTPVAETEFSRALADYARASIVTVPLPVGADDKRLMRSHGAADMCDMESAHVLAYCRARGIPYTGVRVVSDRVDDEIPQAVRASFDGRSFRLRTILGRLAANPSLLPSLLKLARATRFAAERLGAAIAPVFSADARKAAARDGA